MGSWKKEKAIISLLSFLLIMLSFKSIAQRETYIHPGLISTSATLSPTDMLNRKDINYYVTGFLEGKVTKNIGIRGDIHYLLPNDTIKFLKNNVRVFLGMQYGFPINNFEAHIGFAPGFGVMQSHKNTSIVEFMPAVQFNVGFRYYIWKYFHFFGNVQYIHSKMNKLARINGLADEMVYSVGLGFNFLAKKQDK